MFYKQNALKKKEKVKIEGRKNDFKSLWKYLVDCMIAWTLEYKVSQKRFYLYSLRYIFASIFNYFLIFYEIFRAIQKIPSARPKQISLYLTISVLILCFWTGLWCWGSSETDVFHETGINVLGSFKNLKNSHQRNK